MLTYKDCPEVEGLEKKDLSCEEWREYEHGGETFHIFQPVGLYMRKGGTTHRVVDSAGVVHCHPIPGMGCALRWKTPDGTPPVNF